MLVMLVGFGGVDMTFVVRGRISSEKGEPVAGLVVDVYDDDLFIDDYLGSAITDNKGFFEVQFEPGTFRGFLDQESTPDIYLNIRTQEGQVLLTTEVRRNANPIEEFDIKLKDTGINAVQQIKKCSQEQPMYCTTDRLNEMFKMDSLPLRNLANTGTRRMDLKGEIIHDDSHWKGFFAADTLLPPWIFQSGFYKKFDSHNDKINGVTLSFDEIVAAKNVAKEIDPSNPAKGILLEYTEPQFSMFYDTLKIINNDVVIGKAFIGRYPVGIPLLTFAMTRKYNFDFITAKDHRELFEKHGRLPDKNKVLGEWEGRMVSNTSLTPPLFRFRYKLDSKGKITCEYIFMYLLRGNSRVEFTQDQMNMFDFTNFHDEIRMVKDDFMVGKYIPEEQEILSLVGERSLGLLHFEKTPKGTRPAIYYSIKRVSAHR